MRQVRFIHTADLHLDTPFTGLSTLPPSIMRKVQESTFTSFRRIIDIALKENVDFIVIAGDLYDGHERSLRSQAFLKKEFKRLQESDIAVYIIHGNHDHLSGSWVDIGWPANVHFFNSKVEEKVYVATDGTIVALHGFSYPKRAVEKNYLDEFKKNLRAHFQIGILHGQAEGIRDHHPYAPFKVAQLLEKEYDYWALGHVHKRMQLASTIYYPGNIQGRHRKEVGEKGCLLVELNDGQSPLVRFQQTSTIIWKKVQIAITSLRTFGELLDRCEQQVAIERRKSAAVLLEIHLTGHGALHENLKEQQLDELLELLQEQEDQKENFVWTTAIVNRTKGDIEIEKIVRRGDFLSDLVAVKEAIVATNERSFLTDLYQHRRGRTFLTPLSDKEFEDIMTEAQDLLLTELLKEWDA